MYILRERNRRVLAVRKLLGSHSRPWGLRVTATGPRRPNPRVPRVTAAGHPGVKDHRPGVKDPHHCVRMHQKVWPMSARVTGMQWGGEGEQECGKCEHRGLVQVKGGIIEWRRNRDGGGVERWR